MSVARPKPMDACTNRKILIVDDTPSIHATFARILGSSGAPGRALEELDAELFGKDEPRGASATFEIGTAFQGKDAVEMVRRAAEEESPYALAFVDLRMPPGWNGVETIYQLWKVDPRVQVVICSAYSDFSWDEIVTTLGQSDQLLILKKPFDVPEVLQLAHALTSKWSAERYARRTRAYLEELVSHRTAQLELARRRR